MKYRTTEWDDVNGMAYRLDLDTDEMKPITNHQEWFDLTRGGESVVSFIVMRKLASLLSYVPRRHGDESPYICSVEVGTPSKGAMKVYFDPANVEETKMRIKNSADALALAELMRSDEFRESIYARMSIVAGEMVVGELEREGE